MMISPSIFRKGRLDDALLVWLSNSEFTKELSHKDAEQLFSTSNIKSLIGREVSDEHYLAFIKIVISYKNNIASGLVDNKRAGSTFDDYVSWRFDESLVEGCKGKPKSISLLSQYLSDTYLNAGGWINGIIESPQNNSLMQPLMSCGGPYCTSIEKIISHEIYPIEKIGSFIDSLLLKIKKEITVAIEAHDKFDCCFDKLRKTNLSLNLLSLAKSKDDLSPTIYSEIVATKCRTFLDEISLVSGTKLYERLLRKIEFALDDLAESIVPDSAAYDSIDCFNEDAPDTEEVYHAIRGIPDNKFISDIFADYESASHTLKQLSAERMEFFFYRAADMSSLYHKKDLAWILSSIHETQVSSQQMELDLIKAAVKLEKDSSMSGSAGFIGTQLAYYNVFETFDLDYERSLILTDEDCMHGRIHNLLLNQTNNYTETELYQLLIHCKDIASKKLLEPARMNGNNGIANEILEISKILASEYVYPKILNKEEDPFLTSQLIEIVKVGLVANSITRAEFDLIAKYDLSKLEGLHDVVLDFALAQHPDFNEVYIARCLEAKVKNSVVDREQNSIPKRNLIL